MKWNATRRHYEATRIVYHTKLRDMDWDKMTPMERNALIAEKVFGRKILQVDTWGQWLLYHETKPGITEAIPRYSETMDGAWLVVMHMKEMKPYPQVKFHEHIARLLQDYWETIELWDITPEIICLAALKVVEK